MLELTGVGKTVGDETHLAAIDLRLRAGVFFGFARADFGRQDLAVAGDGRAGSPDDGAGFCSAGAMSPASMFAAAMWRWCISNSSIIRR